VPRFVVLLLATACVLLGCESDDPPIEVPPAEDPLWDVASPPTWSLTFEIDDWEAALTALLPVDDDRGCEPREYLEADLEFTNPVDGSTERVERVGVRWHGRSAINALDDDNSRVGLKLSFNAFEPGRRFHDMRKMNLLGTEGDHSGMREYLSLQLMADAGVPAPRSGYSLLYVDGEFMGLYPQTEEPDDEPFVQHHLGSEGGSLFKVNGYCGGRGGFEWEGDEVEDYIDTYEPKAETPDEAILEDLVPMLACVNERDGLVFADCIEDHVDVQAFLTEIAVDMALPDPDGMAAHGKNFMLYREPATGQFVVSPWDKDLAFDIDDLVAGSDIYELHPDGADDFRSEISWRLIEAYEEAYRERVLEVAALIDPDVLLPFIDERREQLTPFVEEDPFVDWDGWSHHVDDIREVIQTWHPQVVEQAEQGP